MPRIRSSGFLPRSAIISLTGCANARSPGKTFTNPKCGENRIPMPRMGSGYKDFGSFKICGDGKYPKTFLLAGQAARGQKL
jgi:hypothetical protein